MTGATRCFVVAAAAAAASIVAAAGDVASTTRHPFYTVLQKVYRPTINNNFDNSCPIPAQVQIAAATLSGSSLRQTVRTHRAYVHQTAKLVAALLMVARVTAGLTESNGSLPPGL